jgi:hypothetical protein
MEGGGTMSAPGSALTPAGRLGAVAPIPFAGTAAILVALIVFTPVLLATGPSALAVQAELAAYRVSGSLTTEFTVHAYDPNVPYRWLNLSLGTGFTWNGGCPTTKLNWTYTNGTNELVASVLTNATAVVVNASAVYSQGGSRTVYAGELAFAILGFGTSTERLAYAPCRWTPSVASAGSWAVSQGALPISLVNYGAGGPS